MAVEEKALVEVQVNSQQAKEQLKDLESHANSLRKQMDAAFAAGDTKHMKQLQRELRNTEKEIRTVKKDTTALTEVMHNLDKATPKELRATLKAINRELDSGHIKRGSAEWKYYQEQAKRVTKELNSIRNESRENMGWLDRFNNGLSKWGGLLASVAAGITGVAMTLNTLRNNRNAKEDAQAELKALTGLGDDSIAWLTEQAELLSTTMEKNGLRIRQSSDEIIKAYMLVGSKKPELLGNKDALNAVTIEAMRLASAAKIDLKEAVEATTISLNMFGENADQAAKYVNVLASGSKAGSATVAAQTATIKNAGVAAATAGVSIEQLNGVIQTLAKKGIEAEPAGTALRKFFLVLQTGADETNPKVVGLDKALENLSAQHLTAAQLQKKFGDEAFSAASIIINGTEDYKHFTAAVTDTNVAVEQAAINSDTASAKMEQHKNRIKEAGIELMEKLNPSLSMLTGFTSKIIAALPGLIDWMIKYKVEIIASSIAVGAYTAAIKASTIATAIHTAKTKVAAAATAALNAVMSASPWGLALTGATTLAAFLGYKYVSSTNEATTAQRDFNKELHKTNEEMDSFQAVKKDSQLSETMSEKQRAQLRERALKEMKILQKDLADKEKAYKDAYDVHIDYLMRMEGASEKFRQKAYKAQKEDFHKKMQSLKPMRDAIAEMDAVIKKLNIEDFEKGEKENPVTIYDDKMQLSENKRYQDELIDLKRSYLESDTMTRKEYNRLVEDAEVRHLEKMMQIAGVEPEKRQQIMQKLLDLRIKIREDEAKEKADLEKDKSDKAASRLQKEYELEIEEVTDKHIQGILSEEKYFNELTRIRQDYYDKVLADTSINEDQRNRLIASFEEANAEQSKQRRDAQLNSQKDALHETVQMAEEYGKQIADVILESDNILKDLVKLTINTMLDMLKKRMIMANTAVYMEAMAAPGFVLKAAFLAKAFAKIAMITAAFETAKGLVSGFEDGGYTGDGAHDEPKGVVHAGEFVANRKAVANPSVKPVLDMIDSAQRNNTVGSLSSSDLSAAMGGNSYSTVNNYNSSNGQLDGLIGELAVVLSKLRSRLDAPIISYTKATGKMSVNEAQELLEKMKRNASRS